MKRAFTLIDILIVIAIAALVVSIAIPILKPSKEIKQDLPQRFTITTFNGRIFHSTNATLHSYGYLFFKDSETGNDIELQGNWIMEKIISK